MTTPRPPSTVAQKLEQGERTIRALMVWWIGRCGLTQTQMAAIACWGQGSRTALNKSDISRLVTGNRGVNVKVLLGLESLNTAVHVWQVEGQDAALAQFGPLSSYRVEPAWLDAAVWLQVPDEPVNPLDLCDFVDVLVGRLPLPYLLTLPSDASKASECLAELLNQAIAAAGLGARDGIRRLLDGYPVKDQGRRERFRDVVLGDVTLTGSELQEELFGVAAAVAAIRGLPVSSYGPDQLAAELQAMAGRG